MRSTKTYVQDILDEMDRIERFVGEMSPDDLQADELVSYAVIKAFENIGEAARQVPDSVRARCPEVMWREMAGMRNRLALASPASRPPGLDSLRLPHLVSAKRSASERPPHKMPRPQPIV